MAKTASIITSPTIPRVSLGESQRIRKFKQTERQIGGNTSKNEILALLHQEFATTIHLQVI